MPKPTRKQLAAEARCFDCDKPLGRTRAQTNLGREECCCGMSFCMDCCAGPNAEIPEDD
jgi:hypothetical protein